MAATPALANGEASLTVSPTAVAPGETITVSGDGLEAGETFTIVLRGITVERTLGTASVAGDGFERSFTVPADAPAGTYEVRATSEEGEVLTAELSVQGGAERTERTASDELMQLDRSRSSVELAVIGVLLLASTAVGVALVRREP